MISSHLLQFYINGAWVTPFGGSTMGVENPATEEIVAEVALGSVADADRAIAAARAAFPGYTTTPVAERIAMMKRVLEVYNDRDDDFVEAMSTEMGAPLAWARERAVLGRAGAYGEHDQGRRGVPLGIHARHRPGSSMKGSASAR